MSTHDWTPGSMLDRVQHIGVCLARWGQRDPAKAQAQVRRAASTAMEEIDQLLRDLYTLRSALVTEIRQDDDATVRRVDALLERGRIG